MTDILIRRCTVRVTRHGGWSWGADRRALVDQVTAALPRLIAARLGELLGESEGDVAEPLRLRIVMRADEIRSGRGLAEAVAASLRPDTLPQLRLATQDRESPSAASIDASAAADNIAGDGDRSAPLPQLAPVSGVRDLLLRWRVQGDLPKRLRGFSLRALTLWLEALFAEARAASAARPAANDLVAEIQALRAALAPSAGDVAATAWARLVLVVELIARHGGLPDVADMRRLLDEIVPLPSGAAAAASPLVADAAGAPEPMDDDVATGAARALGTARSRPTAAPAAATDQAVPLCSVLPFLVLGMLKRVGWLDTAAATFRALDVAERGTIFAAALACKLLPPPERGWHRPDAVARTAAAFAGVTSLPSPHEMRAWCRGVDGGLSPLDSLVATELASGHDPRLPLLIMRVDNRYGYAWLLLDADGRMPVAWERDEAAIVKVLASFGPCVVLVAADAASPALMRGLSDAGAAFVTTARPTRGDDWRRLPGPAGFWTVPRDLPMSRLIEAARLLSELEERGAAINHELVQRRPAAALEDAGELERCAALAAATGLGMLAWTLWREREPVDPLLALERFADLDGTARFTDSTIEIRPAVGRRYLDLKNHALLADIVAVPWFGSRTVTFSGP